MGNIRFRPMTVSEWLDGHGKAKHDAKFVENFDSLADLRAAAAYADVGVAGVLRECEVTTLGDKSVLKKALELDPSSAGAKKTLKEVGMSLMLHADSDDEDSD